MQQSHQTQCDKALLRLQRERKLLRRRNQEKVRIHPPIQRGWMRRFRLTARAKQRPDASALAVILNALNTEQFFWRRSFKHGKHARRRWHETTQSLRQVIHDWQWERFGWPQAWRYRYFRRHETTAWDGRHVVYHQFLRDDLFELYTERHWIYELPLHQPQVISRLAEVEAAVGYDGENRLSNLQGTGYRRGEDVRQKHRAIIDRRRIRMALLGDWEAERTRSMPVFPQPSLVLLLFARVAQQQRHGVESAASVSASLTAGTISDLKH